MDFLGKTKKNHNKHLNLLILVAQWKRVTLRIRWSWVQVLPAMKKIFIWKWNFNLFFILFFFILSAIHEFISFTYQNCECQYMFNTYLYILVHS